MSKLAARDFAGAEDLPRMQLLLRACEAEASYDFHMHDLPEESESNTRLWQAASGELAAMAAVYPPAWLLFVLHPGLADPAAETGIIAWAQERVLACGRPGSGRI